MRTKHKTSLSKHLRHGFRFVAPQTPTVVVWAWENDSTVQLWPAGAVQKKHKSNQFPYTGLHPRRVKLDQKYLWDSSCDEITKRSSGGGMHTWGICLCGLFNGKLSNIWKIQGPISPYTIDGVRIKICKDIHWIFTMFQAANAKVHEVLHNPHPY